MSEIFEFIQRGRRLKREDHVPGDIPYVSSSGLNNGVDAFIGNRSGVREFEHCITIANSGSVGSTFFHGYRFVASDHVTALRSGLMNRQSYIFMCGVMRRIREKYSYNREINEARINRERIMMPIDDEGRPDYEFMSDYVSGHEERLIRRYCEYIYGRLKSDAEPMTLEGVRWGEFFVSDVAKIVSGRGIFDDERVPGDTPYVTASAMNNGVTDYLANTNETLESECLSVNSNGSVGYAFYHPYEALYSGDCRKLRLKVRDKHVGLFVATVITGQRGKYSYGYKLGTSRLKRQLIKLPIDEQGQPDYSFMERFMRHHEHRLLQEYISYLSQSKYILGGGVKLLSLDSRRWAAFKIGDLFRLVPGKGKGANHLESDSEGISYLGATNRNNAVLGFVKPEEGLIQKGNCIAFIRNGEGSMGYSVYKSEDFIATSDITAGYAPFLNRYTGMFITTAADKVRGRYSYNYKRSDTRLKKEMIQLPIDDAGNPDWEFMTEYMKAIEAKLYLQYLIARL